MVENADLSLHSILLSCWLSINIDPLDSLFSILIGTMSDNYLSSLYKFEPDLDAYFNRIGYTGSKEPTFENLKAIQWYHLQAIPFENLDVHIAEKVSIDPIDIQRKMIFEGRGGYCFEQNTYSMWVLRALGFHVTPVLARNRWMKPVDVVTPSTHIILKVKIDNDLYIYDVGFSANASPYPLKVYCDNEQPTALETHRIVYQEKTDTFLNQIFIGGEWKDVFIFTLTESYPYDWEIGNFYVSNCPSFVLHENIVVSFPQGAIRYSLLNNVLTERNVVAGETPKITEIKTEAEYLHVLRTVFKLKLDEGTKICPRNVTWD